MESYCFFLLSVLEFDENGNNGEIKFQIVLFCFSSDALSQTLPPLEEWEPAWSTWNLQNEEALNEPDHF